MNHEVKKILSEGFLICIAPILLVPGVMTKTPKSMYLDWKRSRRTDALILENDLFPARLLLCRKVTHVVGPHDHFTRESRLLACKKIRREKTGGSCEVMQRCIKNCCKLGIELLVILFHLPLLFRPSLDTCSDGHASSHTS